MEPEHYLTKRELARVLSTSERTIERRVNEGMPHVRLGGQLRFRYSAVIEWLEQLTPPIVRVVSAHDSSTQRARGGNGAAARVVHGSH